jgi:glyoxylase-like metal-dependent hydrolase (beta-lactamase superfamily II)
VEVAAGIWHLPVAVERNLPPIVNVYAVESGGRFVLVDVGWDEGSLVSLTAGLAALGATPADVEGVVLTHGHPDHAGLAAEIQELTGCWVGAHPAERRWFTGRPAEPDPSWLGRLGAPPGVSEALRQRFGGAPALRAPRLTDVPDGATVPIRGARRLKAVWTPGHSPGHLCLHDSSGVLFTGDHVLPDLRPRLNESGAEADAVGAFFEGLRRTWSLRAALVLPGHGDVATDPAALHQDVWTHYDGKRNRILAIVGAGPVTAWEVAALLAAPRPEDDISPVARALAANEAQTFLRHLEREGRVRVEGEPERWALR